MEIAAKCYPLSNERTYVVSVSTFFWRGSLSFFAEYRVNMSVTDKPSGPCVKIGAAILFYGHRKINSFGATVVSSLATKVEIRQTGHKTRPEVRYIPYPVTQGVVIR